MSTELAEKIRRLIRQQGPLGIAEYMALCLGDPEHGYYITRDPLGAAGDFTTAPEISQMFGEILGAWLAYAWQRGGAPRPVRLVELGPGRGTLTADILRVFRRVPGLSDAVSVHMVETSPVLRARQKEALARFDVAVAWHDGLADIPDDRPLLLVANEFFDALPIRQYVRQGDIWQERAVGLGPDGALAFGLGSGRLDNGPAAPDGTILELCPAGDAVMAEIAGRIRRHGGGALVVDYGHERSAPGETLQAMRGHAFADPLAEPGEADLTAHVDFGALRRRAEAEGAQTHGPLTQGRFLLDLGLLQRAGQLGAGKDAAAQEAIRAAVERLAGPDQMGNLFKVLALTAPGIAAALPPFAPARPEEQGSTT
ncbi:SAM-dependent methyltransferase, MidA family [Faunimonas pinastri]|uniref:SAM-dependent methyltransferase, MidA family n=1 Tax=Faunimonas pinastri TaxID=1855383 RepID=A0A1H9ASK6_9HYPH|nr:class I SAM-dependent methyltransferase [Faunimonas pinastri]SEP79515.1 SAM-dependent methyltransferase, MidA family [Faunimonas pinastri]